MSDDESMKAGGGGNPEDDISLPKSTVHKLVAELLPASYTCAKDAKDFMAECCKEFVLAIASEANEICEKEAKKTLMPEHIVAALKSLGFDDLVEKVKDASEEHKTLATEERKKKVSKKGGSSGLSQEEMAKLQDEMFKASQARYEAGNVAAAPIEE